MLQIDNSKNFMHNVQQAQNTTGLLFFYASLLLAAHSKKMRINYALTSKVDRYQSIWHKCMVFFDCELLIKQEHVVQQCCFFKLWNMQRLHLFNEIIRLLKINDHIRLRFSIPNVTTSKVRWLLYHLRDLTFYYYL